MGDTSKCKQMFTIQTLEQKFDCKSAFSLTYERNKAVTRGEYYFSKWKETLDHSVYYFVSHKRKYKNKQDGSLCHIKFGLISTDRNMTI